MKKLMIMASFIPWFILFISLCKNALMDIKSKEINKEWIKKNIFRIFRFDNTILFIIFLLFSWFYRHSDQILLTKLLLFTGINIYLIANRYYDKHKNRKEINTEDISTILIVIILSFIPMSIYNLTGYYTVAYCIMFAFSFFNYIVVYLANKINDLVIKMVKKHEN